ncbi:MAG: L,D-transpeptidase [Deltaproteobacteria bacterium]|nr:L,D-transpeptidase [Deltaproteobacteria bacterium]
MMRSVFRMAPQRLTHRTRSRARGLVRALATALLCSAPFTFGVAQAGSGEAGDLLMVIESSTFQLSVLDSRNGERSPTIRVALGSPEQATPTGRFPLERIILSPSWRPGVVATRAGAEPEAASLDTPMGAVKIPFAADGVIALHGGGDRRVLGKPISAGCVRATDADLLRVVAWLDRRDALAAARRAQNGEFHRRFRRPIELVVR